MVGDVISTDDLEKLVISLRARRVEPFKNAYNVYDNGRFYLYVGNYSGDFYKVNNEWGDG